MPMIMVTPLLIPVDEHHVRAEQDRNASPKLRTCPQAAGGPRADEAGARSGGAGKPRSGGAGKPVRHIRAKHPGIGAGPPRRAASARYADGDWPIRPENRALNDPRLVNPTAWQTSVTERFTERSSSQARSTRRRVRYAPGVSPYAARNARMKCAGEYPAAAASA